MNRILYLEKKKRKNKQYSETLKLSSLTEPKKHRNIEKIRFDLIRFKIKKKIKKIILLRI